MIHVIATLGIAPGRREFVLEKFRQLTPLVLQEDGCLDYGPSVDVETGLSRQAPLRGDVITVVERWETTAALETHLQAPHMREFREAVGQDIQSTTLHILAPA